MSGKHGWQGADLDIRIHALEILSRAGKRATGASGTRKRMDVTPYTLGEQRAIEQRSSMANHTGLCPNLRASGFNVSSLVGYVVKLQAGRQAMGPSTQACCQPHSLD